MFLKSFEIFKKYSANLVCNLSNYILVLTNINEYRSKIQVLNFIFLCSIKSNHKHPKVL
jgi:hypothetical protein